jgi:hypothetical protein
MKAVRILAVHAGDKKNAPDKNYKLTLHGIIDDKDYLVHRELFGSVHESADGTWPFILEPPTEGRTFGRLIWGPENFPPEDVNIFQKKIVESEIFTRWAEEEYVYRIIKIIDLLDTRVGRP